MISVINFQKEIIGMLETSNTVANLDLALNNHQCFKLKKKYFQCWRLLQAYAVARSLAK